MFNEQRIHLNNAVISNIISLANRINWRKGDTLNKKGGSSTVYQGIDLNTGKIVAIKTIQVNCYYTVDS